MTVNLSVGSFSLSRLVLIFYFLLNFTVDLIIILMFCPVVIRPGGFQ